MDIIDIIICGAIATFAVLAIILIAIKYCKMPTVFCTENVHTGFHEIFVDNIKVYESNNILDALKAKKYYSDLIDNKIITKSNIKKYELKSIKYGDI